MKILVIALLFFQMKVTSAHSYYSFPDDRMEVIKVSDRIFVVKVTKLTSSKPTVSFGLKSTSHKIEGRILEVIRGKKPDKWTHSACDTKVVDINLARKSFNKEFLDMYLSGIEFDREGSNCKEGEQYLVIYWKNHKFFIHLPLKDQAWRNKIRPKEPSQTNQIKLHNKAP